MAGNKNHDDDMHNDQVLILAILGVTVGMFLWGRWRHDMVAAGSLLVCVMAGLLPAGEAFAGFGHPAVVSVACVLVLSRGLQTSGAVDVLARHLIPAKAGATLSMAALIGLGAVLSGFMNNVGAMALLMPVAIQLARRLDLAPGQVLMPLAFGTILGGMTTLIGTPPNLIVSGFREQMGAGNFGMFDFTPVGLVVAVAGVAFVAVVGWRLVPARKQAGIEGFETGAYLTEARIEQGSKSAGKTLRELDQALDETGAQVVGLVRNEMRVIAPNPRRRLRVGDILVIEAEAEALTKLLSGLGLKLAESLRPVDAGADFDETELSADKDKEKRTRRQGDKDKALTQRDAALEPSTVQDAQTAEGATSADDPANKSRAAKKSSEVSKMQVRPRGAAAEAESAAGRGRGVHKDGGKAPAKTDEKAVVKTETGVGQIPEQKTADKSAEDKAAGTDEIVLMELAVLPGSSMAGRSASDVMLRTAYGLNLLAVSRQGQRSLVRLRRMLFQPGDLLLIQGPPEAISEFASEHGCVPLAERELRIPSVRKAWTAGIIMVCAVALAAFGVLPTPVAFALGVLASMALRTVPPRSVYEAIDWPVIVLLAALIPVAGVMESTGTASMIGRFLIDNVAQGNAVFGLALILIVTMLLTDLMNNAATAAVMCPIAIGTANTLDKSPDSFLMAVAIGASCAFLTPIGHQNNTLILGPGGFRFGDYWRMGLPLDLLVIALSVPLLLIVWPL